MFAFYQSPEPLESRIPNTPVATLPNSSTHNTPLAFNGDDTNTRNLGLSAAVLSEVGPTIPMAERTAIISAQPTGTIEELSNGLANQNGQDHRLQIQDGSTGTLEVLSNGDTDGKDDSFSVGSIATQIAPVTLTFRDLRYTVMTGAKKDKKRRELLKGVSGYAESGRLVAIMGPSGAGKTVLLNALSNRLSVVGHGEITGEILVNGQPRTKNFKSMVGFVTQDDVFFSNLSVLETLLFTARLKIPPPTSKKEIEAAVRRVIRELSLNKATNTRIGNAFVRGVSGGERKRVNIGTEILTNTPILFLDEPTTNLDSTQAMHVMSTLRGVARNGPRAVVSTIHQPRSSIYQLFDDLLLLSEGEIVYFGPAADAVAYFSGLHYQCPEFFNPADYFMDLIAMDRRNSHAEEETTKRHDELVTAYNSSSMKSNVTQRIELIRASPGCDVGQLYSGYAVPYWRQFGLLFMRAFNQLRRDVNGFLINLFMQIFFGLLLGFLYFQMGYSQTNIQDRRGLLFFVLINSSFTQMASVQTTFPVEKGIVGRERQAHLYAVSAYYIAKVTSELSLKILMPLLYAALVYWIAGLKKDAGAFFLFVLILILAALCATSIGLWVSAMSPNVAIASALGPVVMIIFLLFGGFYANRDTIPVELRWIEWISFIRYAFEALAINEFMGVHFSCETNSGAPALGSTSSTGQGCVVRGEDVLVNQMNLGASYGILWRDIGLIIVLTFFFHCLAYVALRKKSAIKRLSLPGESI